jgi:hypothetical protein
VPRSLLLTAIGGVVGIGGAFLALLWQAREARRVRREQYARDDRYRLAERRITASRDFYVAAGTARHTIGRQSSVKEKREARGALWEPFTLLSIIGDKNTREQARNLLQVVTAVGFDNSPFDMDQWDELILNFVQASRLELAPARPEES